jgi:hypothetical protein
MQKYFKPLFINDIFNNPFSLGLVFPSKGKKNNYRVMHNTELIYVSDTILSISTTFQSKNTPIDLEIFPPLCTFFLPISNTIGTLMLDVRKE